MITKIVITFLIPDAENTEGVIAVRVTGHALALFT
jgi:hypothetical protein